MRILYIIHGTKFGGATISFLNLVRGLSKMGVNIGIVVPDIEIDNRFSTECVKNNFEIFKCPVVGSVLPKPNLGLNMYRYFRVPYMLLEKQRSQKVLLSIVDSFKPDIIHSNSGIIHEGFLVARKKHIPHVWHLREYQDLDFNWLILPTKRKFEELLKQSYVIGITKDILKHFHLNDYSHAKVIYNGIYSNTIVREIENKSSYFLIASRLDKEKGIDDVLRAFAIFHKKHPDFYLKIAGFGNKRYISQLNALSSKLGICNNLDFLGFVDNVSLLMSKAKALIVASHHEGFGRMTAEAAFNGCLVIGRNTGGTKEILDYTGGVLFDGGPNEIYECMEKVCELSQEGYMCMALESQRKAFQRYSEESNVDKTFRLYSEILGQ